ncbi:MAG: ribbon-helix-helix protein, CopG family [Moorella humiferrea]|nr:ribbon-helix-helix protein, CopG family [Moorella humiferrea]
MRTTIEISNEIRAKLMALAARRGLRGYSEIVNEAFEEYLARVENREKEINEVLKLAGSLNEEESQKYAARVKEFWSRWKS